MPNSPLRILVVDDNHDNAEIVRQYLEATHDYVVAIAYDGDAAIVSFNESRPDLVLLDVMMPGRDGWEVCRVMKRDPEHAGKTRVIMVTARGQVQDRRTALETGADDFLEKPLELSKLLVAVRRNAAALESRLAQQAGQIDPSSPATEA